jgi:hypothetical protein
MNIDLHLLEFTYSLHNFAWFDRVHFVADGSRMAVFRGANITQAV